MDGSQGIETPQLVSTHRVGCPVCGSPVDRSVPAHIATFLRIKCRLHPSIRGRAHFCASCEHAFFTPLLDAEQLTRLYEGYQDDFYNQERIAIEPIYASLLEVFADPCGSHWQSRWRFYSSCFDPGPVCSVVDFGGGSGAVTRSLLPGATVTIVDEDFERRGGDLAATLGACDLLFAAHVFEHLPAPSSHLQRLSSLMKPGTLAWIEVPKEYPGSLLEHFERFEANPAEAPTAPLRVMHEHICHFSKRSLRRLMKLAGFEVLEFCMSDAGIMAALGRKAAA